MINLVVGPNRFLASELIDNLNKKVGGEYSRLDGVDIDLVQFTDLVAGASLFSTKKVVVIDDLSDNKSIWDKLPEYIERISDDTTLVLVEQKIDRRTKTFKELAKKVKLVLADNWTLRDRGLAEEWTNQRAKSIGLKLNNSSIRQIVERSMLTDSNSNQATIDQQRIATALETLSLSEQVNDDVIATVLPPSSMDNVFDLTKLALSGDTEELLAEIESLSRHEDVHKVFGLLVSQWTQLMALSLTTKSSDEVARDIGAHPFVMKKLSEFRGRISRHKLTKVTHKMAELDELMKTTGLDPWLAVERACLAIGE